MDKWISIKSEEGKTTLLNLDGISLISCATSSRMGEFPEEVDYYIYFCLHNNEDEVWISYKNEAKRDKAFTDISIFIGEEFLGEPRLKLIHLEVDTYEH